MIAGAQLVLHPREDSHPRHPELVAEGNGSGVRVELAAERVDTDPADRMDDLARECLADFRHIHIIDGHSGPVQRLPCRFDPARAYVPSQTTLGALVKHLAAAEREWFQVVLAGRSGDELGAAAG